MINDVLICYHNLLIDFNISLFSAITLCETGSSRWSFCNCWIVKVLQAGCVYC